MEEQLDELGFASALTQKQVKRLKLRLFAAKNQWASLYPTIPAAVRAARQGQLPESLLLSHGIQHEYRPHVWAALVGKSRGGTAMTAAAYSKLAEEGAATLPMDVLQQIELDIPRTFCEQQDFCAANEARKTSSAASLGSRNLLSSRPDLEKLGEGNVQSMLRRMLIAYVAAEPSVGYLQSMNFLAAFCLLVWLKQEGGEAGAAAVSKEQAELQAFQTFHHLCTNMLPGYYCEGMHLLRTDCSVFSAVLASRQPELTKHLDSLGLCDIGALFLPRWLLCCYLNGLPTFMSLRVWDWLLYSGERAPLVLLEICLAIMQMCKVRKTGGGKGVQESRHEEREGPVSCAH